MSVGGEFIRRVYSVTFVVGEDEESEPSRADLTFGNKYGDGMTASYEAVRSGHTTIGAVTAATGFSPNLVRKYLSQLVRARWLYRPSRGSYAVADEKPFMIENYETGDRARPIRG